ncbi:hypothetical protein DPM19_27580 [Actinomadura craniellae]|uniref:Uncharacterized protein n=1 Tax=Actinomadura craniellae TaxID=2231787 RepID=A0A365GZ42_9ACTN|nr:heavy metal-binding domain-containing protein [Actinomadura craniellae]RAY12100.1 hypothetical protein DPM19_27580 [Actinomadura craniellae]
MLIVTTDALPGYDIKAVHGEVLGVAVQNDQARPAAPGGAYRSSGEFGVGLAQARREALHRLAEEARRKGANAVIGMAFDNAFVAGGAHEVCAYGTAVWAEPQQGTGTQPHEMPRHEPHQPPPYEPQAGGPPMIARNLTMGWQGDRRG